jgi:hypothetical protein
MFLLKQEQGKSGVNSLMLNYISHLGPDRHYLISNKEYVIGRKNTDIVIGNDQSISRKHAIIKIVVSQMGYLTVDKTVFFFVANHSSFDRLRFKVWHISQPHKN